MNINTKKYYDGLADLPTGGGVPEDVRKRIDMAFPRYNGYSIEFAKMHNMNDGALYGYYLATEKLKEQEQEIERLKQENERLMGEGWISVEDRLPEDDEDYQVWEQGAIIATAAHYRTKKYFLEHYENEDYMEEGWYYSFKYPFDEKLDTDNPIEVTHWMPLIPPPPKSK